MNEQHSPITSPPATTGRLRRWAGAVFRGLGDADPILQAALVVALLRVVGLFRHYLGTDLLGHPVSLEPVRFLPWAVPYHVGTLLAVGVIIAALVRILPRWRRAAFGVTLVFLGFLLFFGQLDLELLRGLGQHLTLGFIGQHFGSAMFTDISDGMEDDLTHLLGSGALILVGWILLGVLWRRRRNASPRRSTSALLAVTALTAGLLAFPHVVNKSGNRLRVITPPEVLALVHALNMDATPAPADEAAAIAELRAVIAPGGAGWLDARYPTARAVVPPSGPTGRPDIFLVVIESLRGRELLPPGEDPAGDHPHLAALSRRGVVFPYFVSNGFPSAQAFFSLHCSAWPHPRRYVLSDLASGRFDCFPGRLRDLGYETAFFSASNPTMDNQLPWVRRMYENIEARQGKTFDRRMVDHFLGWLERRDAAADDRPLFAWIATTSLHTPFVPPDPELPGPVPDELADRYGRGLRYTDEQVGRIFSALEARARDTVIIVVGDHASPLPDEPASPERAAAPCDRLVWTAAVIVGPEALVGPPRVVEFPASQVDVMPTILALVGDGRPTAAVGRDLLRGDTADRTAVVVHRGGVRVDTENYSIFASADGGDRWAQRRLEHADCEGDVPLTPELDALARGVHRWVEVWSWLLEADRVWDPALLAAVGRPMPAPARARAR